MTATQLLARVCLLMEAHEKCALCLPPHIACDADHLAEWEAVKVEIERALSEAS